MQSKPGSLDEIKAAARQLFIGDRTLSIWEALERVLEGLTTPELSSLYYRSGQEWCLQARRDGDMVQRGIEVLGVQMRRADSLLRGQDDSRSRASVSRPPRRRTRRQR